MYDKIAQKLDGIASDLESKGLVQEACDLDVMANTLEKMASNQQVKQLFEDTKEMNSEHADTLLGERPAGSKWGESLTEQKLVGLPWKEWTEAKIPKVMQAGSRYFILRNAGQHFPNARQRMESLADAEKKGYTLSVRRGAHGLEIVSPQVKNTGITEAWLIAGAGADADGKNVPGKMMIWTLYPGRLTGTDPEWDGKLESIPEERKPYVAVKAPQ